MNLRETYDRIAADWHRDHEKDTWWIEGTDDFISLLPKGASVLDLGCGGGTKTLYLTKAGLNVTGLDFSQNFLNIAKKVCPQSNFIQMNMLEKIPLSLRFDGIFAQASLLHVPRKLIQSLIIDLTNLINPDGLFYVAVKEKRGKDEEVVTENDYGYSYERFFSYYYLHEVEGFMVNAGLDIVCWRTAGSTNWIQVIGRK